jgi:hypothetical protein
MCEPPPLSRQTAAADRLSSPTAWRSRHLLFETPFCFSGEFSAHASAQITVAKALFPIIELSVANNSLHLFREPLIRPFAGVRPSVRPCPSLSALMRFPRPLLPSLFSSWRQMLLRALTHGSHANPPRRLPRSLPPSGPALATPPRPHTQPLAARASDPRAAALERPVSSAARWTSATEASVTVDELADPAGCGSVTFDPAATPIDRLPERAAGLGSSQQMLLPTDAEAADAITQHPDPDAADARALLQRLQSGVWVWLLHPPRAAPAKAHVATPSRLSRGGPPSGSGPGSAEGSGTGAHEAESLAWEIEQRDGGVRKRWLLVYSPQGQVRRCCRVYAFSSFPSHASFDKFSQLALRRVACGRVASYINIIDAGLERGGCGSAGRAAGGRRTALRCR